MNLLSCNMRPNFASGMPPRNLTQKMQFHHASTPSLENLLQSNRSPVQQSDKYFHNPNIFKQNIEKSIPSSYNHINQHVDKVQEKNALNSCILITDEAKPKDIDRLSIEESLNLPVETIHQNNIMTENLKNKLPPTHLEIFSVVSDEDMSCSDSDSDKMLIEDMPNSLLATVDQNNSEPESRTEMEVDKSSSEDEMSCSDSEDSFIEFKCQPGPSRTWSRQSPVFDVETSSSSSDDDDEEEDWCEETVVFHKSKSGRERQSSLCESEDSFIVFDGEGADESDDPEVKGNDTFIVFEDEDSDEELVVKVKKPDNGKKVSFAEGPDLRTVHLMVKWSFAYQKARKGLWEQFARDNARFKYRADQFGTQLNKYLQPEHRRKIYEERFKDRQE